MCSSGPTFVDVAKQDSRDITSAADNARRKAWTARHVNLLLLLLRIAIPRLIFSFMLMVAHETSLVLVLSGFDYCCSAAVDELEEVAFV